MFSQVCGFPRLSLFAFFEFQLFETHFALDAKEITSSNKNKNYINTHTLKTWNLLGIY